METVLKFEVPTIYLPRFADSQSGLAAGGAGDRVCVGAGGWFGGGIHSVGESAIVYVHIQ